MMNIFAPDAFSKTFCVSLCIAYIIQNILYMSLKKENTLLCFEFFFAISFFLVYFVHPCFLYPTKSYLVSHVFSYPYNECVISKSTAIAYLAYTSFLMIVSYKNNTDTIKLNNNGNKITEGNIFVLLCTTLISLIGFGLSGGFSHLKMVYTGGTSLNDVGVFSYFFSVFQCLIIVVAIYSFQAKTKVSRYISLMLVCLSICAFLLTGSRNLPFRLVFILLFGFNMAVRPFRKMEIICITVFGAFFLYIIMTIRGTGISESITSGILFDNMNNTYFWRMFSDLIMNNRNHYVLVDYADANGLTFFKTQLSDICAPVPFLFNAVNNVLNIPPEMAISGSMPTFITFHTLDSWGLGTAMVGEAYLSFGTIGTIICFALLGLIINVSKKHMYTNKYALTIYFLFCSHAIFYPRAPLIFDPRIVVWILIFTYIFSFCKIRNKKSLES